MTREQLAAWGPEELADDAIVGELVDGLLLHLAVLVAHEAGLFRRLAAGPLSLRELARSLGFPRRQTASMVAAAAAFGLVDRAPAIALSASGRALLAPESPRYAGSLLDLGIGLCRGYTYDRLADALRGGGEPTDWTEALLGTPPSAEAFTRAMHAHSLAPAALWPRRVSLAGHRRLLDLGGGSGVHSIGALAVHPHLEAVVFELPQVCPAARAQLAASGLGDRIAVVAGDLWVDPYPPADLHLLSDVLHDWPPARCRELLSRSFEALPAGGRVLIHEMLLDDDRLGPPTATASDLAMLLVNGGQQYTREELFEMLTAAGFVEPTVCPVLGDWHLVGGRKP